MVAAFLSSSDSTSAPRCGGGGSTPQVLLFFLRFFSRCSSDVELQVEVLSSSSSPLLLPPLSI
jgi:hypothetical protein